MVKDIIAQISLTIFLKYSDIRKSCEVSSKNRKVQKMSKIMNSLFPTPCQKLNIKDKKEKDKKIRAMVCLLVTH